MQEQALFAAGRAPRCRRTAASVRPPTASRWRASRPGLPLGHRLEANSCAARRWRRATLSWRGRGVAARALASWQWLAPMRAPPLASGRCDQSQEPVLGRGAAAC
eukprot:scaffold8418_cov106-Isochrysis_galbana.AAC.1